MRVKARKTERDGRTTDRGRDVSNLGSSSDSKIRASRGWKAADTGTSDQLVTVAANPQQ